MWLDSISETVLKYTLLATPRNGANVVLLAVCSREFADVRIGMPPGVAEESCAVISLLVNDKSGVYWPKVKFMQQAREP